MIAVSPSSERMTELPTDTGYWPPAQPDETASLVYAELRRLAHIYMTSERRDHTLQPTALVNEAYVRLLDRTSPMWRDRNHFCAGAARMMRHILVDYAKSRGRAKRGGGAIKVELREESLVSQNPAEQMIELNDALERLARLDRRASQMVELRYFGGMNCDEIAAALQTSERTVSRGLRLGLAWLRQELQANVKHKSNGRCPTRDAE